MSGVLCDPWCAAGYRKVRGSAFVITCSGTDNKYDDTSGITCLVECTALPDQGASYDGSACSVTAEGDVCLLRCAPGFTGSDVTRFTCPAGGGVPPVRDAGMPLPVCTANACTAGAVSPADHVDYTPCTGLSTGGTCTPVCLSGYIAATAATAFPVVCAESRKFSDDSGILCRPSPCTGGPRAAAANVDYTPCATLKTGEKCTPTCSDGYVSVGGVPFTLTCSSTDQTYVDAAGLSCSPHSCAHGAVNPSPTADYTGCMALYTGGECTPRCAAGHTLGSVTPFTLVCSRSSTFTDFSAIACTANACSSGPATVTANVRYALCNAMLSGSLCTPTCATGYVVSPLSPATPFVLACTAGNRYDDTSGLQCDAEKCLTGPANGNPLADYTACNALSTGEACAVVCKAGYRKTAGNDFILSCTSGVYTDGSSIACVANACTNGPTAPPANSDLSSCSQRMSGQVCEPACATGYLLRSPASFTLECTAGLVYAVPPTVSVVCDPEACTKGPTVAADGADYSSCNAQRSGDTCSVVCGAGYTQTAAPSGFTLLCRGGAYADTSGIVCTPNSCSGGPESGDPLVADYSVCSASRSGAQCTPACASGHHRPTPSFTLACSQSGTYPDTARCIGETCSAGPTNPVPNANYTTCLSMSSGDSCTPTCREGFKATSPPSAFPLLCPSGVFTEASGLVCESVVCTAPPSSASLDYTACIGLQTGQACTPVCRAGYATLAQGAITLVCSVSDGTFADTSTASCAGLPCSGGPKPPAGATLPQHADYTSCNAAVSGDMCAVSCVQGYAVAVFSTFRLSCVGTVYEDISSVDCRPATCSGGAVLARLGADYSACTSRATGDACLPTCAAGFTSVAVGTPFTLVCGAVDGRFADTSGLACTQLQCSGGPLNGTAGVDYSACTERKSGQFCTPVCAEGYFLDPAVTQDVSFLLTCSDAGYAVLKNPACVPHACTMPAVAVASIDYSQCVSMETGGVCIPQCAATYIPDKVAQPFPLLCRASGVFQDTSGLSCVPAGCVAPSNPNPNGLYTPCEGLRTGDSCTPECKVGYTRNVVLPFMLHCAADGSYADNSQLQCDGAACVRGALQPVLRVNYSSCELLHSGDQCTPECTPGYFRRPPTPLQLLCVDFRFNDTTNGQCVEAVCNTVTGPALGVDYSPCVGRATGDTCTPGCQSGYVLDQSDTMALLCQRDGTFTDTTATVCRPETCDGGVVAPVTGIDFSPCHLRSTGQACTPQCAAGFVNDPAAPLQPFDLLCVGSVFNGVVNGRCLGSRCSGGPTNPSPFTTYAACNALSSGEVCSPACVTGAASAAALPTLSLLCDRNGQYTAPDVLCQPNPCTAGPTTAQPGADYTSCSSQATGGTCTVVCEAGFQQVGGLVFDLTCLPSGYQDLSGIACVIFEGECLTSGQVCVNAKQTCTDATGAAVVGDWQCGCVAPAAGSPATAGVAVCTLDECTAMCATCALDVCSLAGQGCHDPDKSSASLGDWQCQCLPPATGSAQRAAASCSSDECLEKGAVCVRAGQTCHDPDFASVGNWQCRCGPQATGASTGAVAVCTFSGECIAQASACTSAGQSCVDPDAAVTGDWQCVCVAPQNGTAGNKGPGSCEFNECMLHACGERQTCTDPAPSLSSLRDWVCRCPAPLTNTAQAGPATCVEDECAGHRQTCTAVGQECVDPDTSTYDSWECRCLGSSTGSTTAGVATCLQQGECAANFRACTNTGQFCVDPSNAPNDWECHCLVPGFAPTKLGPGPCVLDECTATCSTCAGTTCTDQGQTCTDDKTGPANVKDWQCHCTLPAVGSSATAGAAACIFDECSAADACGAQQECTDPDKRGVSRGDYTCTCLSGTGMATGAPASCESDECQLHSLVCLRAGQSCSDPNPSIHSTGDWQCRCNHGLQGTATAGPATCVSTGECILQHTTCKPGESCVDPSAAAIGDWECRSSPLDECAFNRSACTAAGQGCEDPTPTSASIDDWLCRCALPLTGNATIGPAACNMDECQDAGLVCAASAQLCHDPDTSAQSPGDWECACTPPAVGTPSRGSPAVCALDECRGDTICAAAGQTCVDPVPDPMSLADWQCTCPAEMIGTPALGTPATCEHVCIPAAVEGYTAACPAGQPSCAASSLTLTCAVGHTGVSPRALCSFAQGAFAYSGCVPECSLRACPAPTQCRRPGVCLNGQGCLFAPVDGIACNDGSSITSNDTCTAGQCLGAALCGGTACASTNECLAAACAGSRCVAVPLADGVACTSPGGGPGVCGGGACATPDLCAKRSVTCAAKSGCHSVGTCDPLTGLCSDPPVGDGTPCDDGDTLTSDDRCTAGLCRGVVTCNSQACPAAASPCKSPFCSPASAGKNESCVEVDARDGVLCDDGDASTKGDACRAGACVGVPRCDGVVCSRPPNSCVQEGVCQPVTGECAFEPKQDFTTCNDMLDTTVNDVCVRGVCGALCRTVTCPPATQCSAAGTCDARKGECLVETAQFDGQPCDDSDPTTVGDACAQGVCVGTDLCKGVTCTADSECHDAGVCEHATGKCTTPKRPDGSRCNDGDDTTITDQCNGGVCEGLRRCGGQVCPLSPVCRSTACSPANECLEVPSANAAPCDDSDATTSNDTCWDGQCVGCPDCSATTCLEAGVCDQRTGNCSRKAKADSTPCDDGNPDTVDDRCLAGECAGITACGGTICPSPSSPCKVPICVVTRCAEVSLPDNTPCDDSNPHTLEDACRLGVCRGTAPCATVQCLPVDQCRGAGVCNASALPGVCSSELLQDGIPCDDFNAATRDDACISGECEGSSKCVNVTCTAASECHQAGSCEALTGLCTAPTLPRGTPCSGTGFCIDGGCVKDTACSGVQCPQVDAQCAEPVCDATAGNASTVCGVRYAAEGLPCHDGDPATQNDRCVKGVCVGDNLCAAACVAAGPCRAAGVCDPATGRCTSPLRPDGDPCRDGSPLSVSGKCHHGQCVTQSRCRGVVCAPSDACHAAGDCDEATGLCSDPPAVSEVCDDGNPDTTHDICSSGVCKGSLQCGPRICTASDARCHTVECSPALQCVEVAKRDGSKCNDFDPATEDDICLGGVCMGADPCEGVQCPPTGAACMSPGICLRGQCTEPTPASSSTPCDDGSPDTDGDTCTHGACRGTLRCDGISCSAKSQCHLPGTCDPATGVCSDILKRLRSLCDDGTSDTVQDTCRAEGVCLGVPLYPSHVRIDIGIPQERSAVETKRANLLQALSTILGLPEKDLGNVVVSAANATSSGGAQSTVTLILSDTERLPPAAAARLEDIIRSDLLGLNGVSVLEQAFLKASSVRGTPLQAADECSGTPAASTCLSAGQRCEDPTPFGGFLNDWRCRCPGEGGAVAVGGPAFCSGPEPHRGAVPVHVFSNAMLSSPAVTGIADPVAAWLKVVADAFNINATSLSAETGGTVRSDLGNLTEVGVVFHGEAEARRRFVETAACCPRNCDGITPTGNAICARVGLAALRRDDMDCKDYDTSSLCGLRYVCAWGESGCLMASVEPESYTAQWVIIAAGGAAFCIIFACIVWCMCRVRKRSAAQSRPVAKLPTLGNIAGDDDTAKVNHSTDFSQVYSGSPKFTDYITMGTEGQLETQHRDDSGSEGILAVGASAGRPDAVRPPDEEAGAGEDPSAVSENPLQKPPPSKMSSVGAGMALTHLRPSLAYLSTKFGHKALPADPDSTLESEGAGGQKKPPPTFASLSRHHDPLAFESPSPQRYYDDDDDDLPLPPVPLRSVPAATREAMSDRITGRV